MSLSLEQKKEIIKKFGVNERDTGSFEVQIALLSADIAQLTEHFKVHRKDHHSRQGLIRKVNLRRRLLSYLKEKAFDRYSRIIAELKLRG